MRYFKFLRLCLLSIFALCNSTFLAATQFSLVASYILDNSWQTGYQVTVTLKNNTSTPSSVWGVTFVLPQGQSLGNFWNGVMSANGQVITVTNPSWIGGGTIPSNGSTTFGFIVNNPQASAPNIINLQALASNDSSNSIPVPSAPTLNPISVSPAVPSTYTVSWNSVSNASSYTLQQATTSNFTKAAVVAQGSMLSKTLNNQPNGNYFYRVSASNTTGTSAFSNTQSVIVNAQTVPVNAPVMQSINNVSGANRYQVQWSAVANALGYILEQSTSNNFSSAQTIFNGSATATTVSVQSPGTYYYRVKAFSKNATSVASNIVSTLVTQSPVQPTPLIESYWESWNSADPINAIINMHVDIINIAFANFATTGNHTYAIAGVECSPTVLAQFVTAAHNAGKKVKIAVGGATYPLAPQLQTVQDAVGMARAIAQYVQQNNLDGVDFDIEDYPAPALQIALLQSTRELLGSNALITYTPKSPAATTYPYNAVIKDGHSYVNAILIMAYDYGPGYNYQQDAQALITMGVPAAKVFVGLMPGLDDLGVMTSVAHIVAAAQYIIQNKLGGIMFWDLNRDLSNQTGLGSSAATNSAWNVFH